MSDDKLRMLIKRLLVKTIAGEVRWSETPSQEAFQASFPSYSVEVECAGGATYFRVYNSEGRVLDWTSDKVIEHEDKENFDESDDAEKLIELYGLARRQALGVERALDELLATLT